MGDNRGDGGGIGGGTTWEDGWHLVILYLFIGMLRSRQVRKPKFPV
jgi:hypothetical protein